MFIKSKVEPLLTSINELSAGLETYNLLTNIKENRQIFAPLFCPSYIFHWDYDTLHGCLKAEFSEMGTNKRAVEVNIFKLFTDFVECCFMDGIYTFLINLYWGATTEFEG